MDIVQGRATLHWHGDDAGKGTGGNPQEKPWVTWLSSSGNPLLTIYPGGRLELGPDAHPQEVVAQIQDAYVKMERNMPRPTPDGGVEVSWPATVLGLLDAEAIVIAAKASGGSTFWVPAESLQVGDRVRVSVRVELQP